MTEKAPTHPEPTSDQAPGSPRTKLIIGIVLVLVITIIGMAFYATAQTRTVTLAIDGTAQSLQTRTFTVGALLDEQQIILNPADLVTPSVETVLQDGQVIRIDRAHPVLVQIDDVSTELNTPLNTPAEILASMGIEIQDDASISINGEAIDPAQFQERLDTPIRQIMIHNTQPFSVVIESAFGNEITEQLSLRSALHTVGEALYEAGIELYLADSVTPDLSAPLLANLEIHVQRAQPVNISVDGTTLIARVLEGTVADALAAANIALMGQDYTIPELNVTITPDTTIRVVRVKENLLTETQSVAFDTIYQVTTDSTVGDGEIIQVGRDGIEQIVTRIRIEDGEESERTIIQRTLLVAPQPQIIARAP